MKHKYTSSEKTFWIAHGDKKIHTGVLPPGKQLSTGMPYFETFTSPRAYAERLGELKREAS